MADNSRPTDQQEVSGEPEKPEIFISQNLRDQVTQSCPDSLLQTGILFLSLAGLLSGDQDPDGEEAEVDGGQVEQGWGDVGQH